MSDVLLKIKRFLSLQKFKKALKLVLKARETFKNEQLFKYVLFLHLNTIYIFVILLTIGN